MKVSVIIPAAGLGTRMGRSSPEKAGISRKQFMLLNNSPTSYTAYRTYQMSRFDGASWKPFGPVYSAD